VGVQQTTGFVDAHSHLRSTPLHSHGISGCANLEEALLRFTAMTSVDLEDDAFVASTQLLAAGVTGVQVMFYTFADSEGYLSQLQQLATGVQKSGIRALIILGVTDQAEFLPSALDDLDLLPPWLASSARLKVTELPEILKIASKQFPELEFGVGPVGPQWCSDRTLAALGEIAGEQLRVHSHLLESNRQRAWAGENPLDRLIRNGLLGPKTSLAHGVWCTREDLSKIADAGSQLVTCPGSNASLRAGTADLKLWQQAEVEFGFGLDSAEVQVNPMATALSAMDKPAAFRCLTRGGMASTDLRCDQDLVTWSDLDKGECESVTVNGKTLVENGILSLESEVLAAQERIKEQLAQDGELRGKRQRLLDELMPAYQEALETCLA
jgi:cytosine/adenosine deaminase-related metal-dependent hydrolase